MKKKPVQQQIPQKFVQKSLEKKTQQDWTVFAMRRLRRLLKIVKQFPELQAQGPKADWSIELQMVGRSRMSCLNHQYRNKNDPTDVLSFPTPLVFWNQGYLGDLVLCLPILKGQAKVLGHPGEVELEVLLIHGVLHLLGLDHEKNTLQSHIMAQWEAKILAVSLPACPVKHLGLIHRAKSDMRNR